MTLYPYEIRGTLLHIFRAHCQSERQVTTNHLINLLDWLAQSRCSEAGRWQQGGRTCAECQLRSGTLWGAGRGGCCCPRSPRPRWAVRPRRSSSSGIPAARPGTAAQQNQEPDSGQLQQSGCKQDVSNSDTAASLSWEDEWAASESRWPETTELPLLDSGHRYSYLHFSSKTRLRSCTVAVCSWSQTTIHHLLRCATRAEWWCAS